MFVDLTAVQAEVQHIVESIDVVDLHTHLFPPSHNDLMLWGIDSLLTYHYLVAELFMFIPPNQLTPSQFRSLSQHEQADIIFKELFCKRTPLSEACRGVVTCLQQLGLSSLLQHARATQDLHIIREWFAQKSPSDYFPLVLKIARVKYVVMTNIPFEPTESIHWRQSKPVPPYLKAALRVDDLLVGNWDRISRCLETDGYEVTIEGCIRYINDWIDIMQPIYLMASTPSGFVLKEASTNVNAIDHPDGPILLEKVLIPIAIERKLALALKIGARRNVNPELGQAGDGLEVADLTLLRDLCSKFPNLKVLATVLSRQNQHELCVLARKFGNLHIYGCWWFCNNPSIIDEVTKMRVEMLGTAFTCQHSDARVVDQLLYKWHHSRHVIGQVLTEKYKDLIRSGWELTREEIQRDAELLFGGAFEAFLAK
eukprot:c4310_g1_i1.p1 GENE.c4310_g1_i1~~c4310_g1_i1.p1  ORF type:complete len:426 (-),score=90.72 c4310_g1_i1:63-1340(-)